MPEQSPLSTEDQLQQIARQLELVSQRLERVETRLGLGDQFVSQTPTSPAAPPLPVVAPPVPPKAVAATSSFGIREDLDLARKLLDATRDAAGRRAAASGAASTNAASTGASVGGKSFFPAISADWEQLVGGKGALWAGAVAVFLAIAFFLAYAWNEVSQSLLTPPVRFALGLGAGALFVAVGARAKQKPLAQAAGWFGEGLIGAGLAIFYLVIWAGMTQYHLLAQQLAFALMAGVTITGVALAVRFDAPSLSALATLGGFLTPLLLRGDGAGHSSAVPFLLYVSLLNAGIVGVALFKRWRGLTLLAFAATLLLLLGWSSDSYETALRWPVFLFVSLNFVLFLASACLPSLRRQEETQPEELLLLFADTTAYALAGFALLHDALGRFPGVFPLALAAFFAFGAWTVRALAPQNRALRASIAGLCLLALTIAVPIQLGQFWVAVAWSIESAVLLTLARRLNAPLLMRAAQAVWALSLGSLALAYPTAQAEPPIPFVNERALPLLASALATAWMAILCGPKRGGAKDELAPAYAAYATLAGAWLLAQEIYEFWNRGSGGAEALFVTAMAWSLFALAVVWGGAKSRNAAFRVSGYAVAGLAAILPIWGAMLSVTNGLTTPPDPLTPFWNVRWLCCLVVGASLTLMGRLIARESQPESDEAEALGVLPAVVSLLALAGLSAELFGAFGRWQIPTPTTWQNAAFFVMAMAWSLFALGLLLLGLKWHDARLRQLAGVIGLSGVTMLLLDALDATGLDWTPVLNARFGAFAWVLAATICAAVTMRRQGELSPWERDAPRALGLMAVALLWWGVTQEINETCRFARETLGPNWERWAQMAISLAWSLMSASLLIAGIARSFQPLRLAGLGLLGVTVLKVFLFDLSFLDGPLRALAFGGLGVALIGISFLYSRFGAGRAGASTPPAKP